MVTTIKWGWGFKMLVSIGFSILAAIACACNPIESSPSQPNKWISTQVRVEQRCLVRENLSNSLNHLSLGTQPEVNHAKQILIDTSSRSPSCRSEVISLLMSAMDKPSIDFKDDEGSYYLWLYGAEILGDLKATEALDLLISHLSSSTATFSTSMKHQPAIRGVIKMGPVAIPKLNAVLVDNSDPKMRHSAVYCIATIGGPTAVQSLKRALPSETDKCVSRFIRVSLDSFDDDGNIKDRSKWFAGISCPQ